MAVQRQKHKIVVEEILPEEGVSLLLVVSKAHIARQSVAIDLHIAAVGTLEGNLTLSAVDDLELCQFALVAGMSIVEHAVLQGNSRAACCLVDDANSLAVRDVLRTVGTRFFNSKVVKLCISALITLYVESKESMTRTLEADELIGQRHHAAQCLEVNTICRVGILHLVIVVVTDTTKPEFSVDNIHRGADSIVGHLLKGA